MKRSAEMRSVFWVVLLCAGCSDAKRDLGADDLSTAMHDLSVGDLASASGDMAHAQIKVVVNEVYPNGPSTMDPDWIELKNLGASTVDVGGYFLRDSKASDLTALPSGTTIPAGGYLVVYCDDESDGGIVGGVHMPYKLSGSKGDEVHFVATDGTTEVDSTSFMPNDVASMKAWGRLPDGTGSFATTTPTRGATNTM
jgi:Lamin Tail Domain